MDIGARHRRWRWFLLAGAAVLVLALALNFVTLPLHDSDKIQAARELVAWIVESQSIPGFGQAYPDARWMPEQKRFFVLCDFLPAEVSLSEDPRVQRITASEHDEAFKKHGFHDTDYLVIELKSQSDRELVVEISNAFAALAGHGYRFVFCRKLWGLRASGEFLWVA